MAGVVIEALSRDDTLAPCDPWVDARVRPAADGGAKLVFAVPAQPIRPGDVLATMWEADRLTPDAVANCNRARCVIVPCEAVAGWFRDSGVTVPVRVVPLGIDLDVFRPIAPEPVGTVVFGAAARTAHGGVRKGLADVFAAFSSAFPRHEDVELRVKAWADCEVPATADPRITVDRRALSEPEVADWLRGLSAFVTASRGEGWGFWAHQSLAVGRPIVAPLWGGTTAFADESCSYPVEFDLEPVPDGTPHYGGYGARWCVPRPASLVGQMRSAYFDMNRSHKGQLGAALARRFGWGHAGREMVAALREFGLVAGKELGRPRRGGGPAEPPSLYALAELCPMGSGPCGCGAEPRLCGHPDRPLEVWRSDCLRCVAAGGLEL